MALLCRFALKAFLLPLYWNNCFHCTLIYRPRLCWWVNMRFDNIFRDAIYDSCESQFNPIFPSHDVYQGVSVYSPLMVSQLWSWQTPFICQLLTLGWMNTQELVSDSSLFAFECQGCWVGLGTSSLQYLKLTKKHTCCGRDIGAIKFIIKLLAIKIRLSNYKSGESLIFIAHNVFTFSREFCYETWFNEESESLLWHTYLQ